MKVASAKAKGRKLQQWVRDKILGLHKSFHPEDVRSTAMGQGGEDVQLSKYVRDVFPYQFECKSWAAKRLPVYEFYDQAKSCGPHQPVVVIKGTRRKPLVIMDAEHWFELMKEKFND